MCVSHCVGKFLVIHHHRIEGNFAVYVFVFEANEPLFALALASYALKI